MSLPGPAVRHVDNVPRGRETPGRAPRVEPGVGGDEGEGGGRERERERESESERVRESV